GNPERTSLPQALPVLVDDTCGVEHLADTQTVVQRAGEPERDDTRIRYTVRRSHADPHRAQAEPLGDALLGARRAGERQPVSVHATLRTVSLRLVDDSNAADGSNPEWIPQCSQRGS